MNSTKLHRLPTAATIMVMCYFSLILIALGSELESAQKLQSAINKNGNIITAPIAKSLCRSSLSNAKLKSLTEIGIDQLMLDVASNEANIDQILITSLHKDREGIIRALEHGREIARKANDLVNMGTPDGDGLVEKTIFYDLALVPVRHEERVATLLKDVLSDERLAFRAAVSSSVRFIQNEQLVATVLEEYLTDKRNLTLGAPSGTNYFLRVCDETVYSYYQRQGKEFNSKTIMPDSVLTDVLEDAKTLDGADGIVHPIEKNSGDDGWCGLNKNFYMIFAISGLSLLLGTITFIGLRIRNRSRLSISAEAPESKLSD